MKVALVQAPFWGVGGPPYGIACLSAYLRQHGYDVFKQDINIKAYAELAAAGQAQLWGLNQPRWGEIDHAQAFYVKHKDLFDDCLEEILTSGSRVVGFSVLWSTEMISRLLARQIKQRAPSRLVVFGGPQCVAASARRLIGLPEVDYVVEGEGEETFLALLEAVRAGSPVPVDRPLLSKQVSYGAPQRLIRDLDTLPFADFDGFPLDAYQQPLCLPVSTSRGCPNRCHYCDEKVFWQRFRSRGGQRIFDEVRHHVERHGVRRFEFTDSLVNGKIDHLEQFCDLVNASGLKIEWIGQAVVRKEMTKSLLQKIKDSGCVHLCFGAEHSNVDFMVNVGKVLAKGSNLDRLIRESYEVRLPLGLNWMFGIPGQSHDDFLDDLRFFTRNAPYLQHASINNSPGFCGFTPGSAGYERPGELGIVLGPDGNSWKSKDGSNTYITRLRRYQQFCQHLDSLGIRYAFPAYPNESELIGNYYFDIEKDYESAQVFYSRAMMENRCCDVTRERLAACGDVLKAKQSGERVYIVPMANDHNWCNGVARDWAAAFFLPATAEAQTDMVVGREVVLSDGTRRIIASTRENDGSLVVFLEGQPLDALRMEAPVTVRLAIDDAPPPPNL
ncbi:MAG: cobalamin B12-binding domain-containing protein [Rhodospirillales bacterium]|jgi:hypothetical protein|nr:cobalamin B12-binding domain-containing protein [Rhodospirillales bacterium]